MTLLERTRKNSIRTPVASEPRRLTVVPVGQRQNKSNKMEAKVHEWYK